MKRGIFPAQPRSERELSGSNALNASMFKEENLLSRWGDVDAEDLIRGETPSGGVQ